MCAFHIIPRTPCNEQLRNEEEDAADLQRDLEWAASRPGSMWKGPGQPSLEQHGKHVFEECLTDWEAGIYESYIGIQRDTVYSLNQKPDHRCMLAKHEASPECSACLLVASSCAHVLKFVFLDVCFAALL